MLHTTLIRAASVALLLSVGILAQERALVRFGSSGSGVGGRPVVGGSIYGYVASKGTLEVELRKLGVDLQWNFFTGAAPAANEAFANGLLDFTYLSEQASLVGRASGIKYRAILVANRNSPGAIAVVPDSKATRVEDLRGKKVALYKGTGTQLTAGRILAAHSLSEKDLAIQNLTNDQAKNALATHQIDAAFVGTTQAIQYRDQGLAKILYNSKDDPKVLGTSGVILVSEAFEKAHPDIVQKVVDVLVEATWKISQPELRETVLQEWAKSGTSYSIWKQDAEGVSFKERFNPRFDAEVRDEIAKASEEIVKFRIGKGGVDLSEYIEPRYVEEAIRKLQLSEYWQRSR